jgi:hypothetical protein
VSDQSFEVIGEMDGDKSSLADRVLGGPSQPHWLAWSFSVAYHAALVAWLLYLTLVLSKPLQVLPSQERTGTVTNQTR